MAAECADVLIVGSGPAGLAAAIELRRQGVGQVVVVDREPEPGGIPRLCHHTGFGVFDLRRVYTGPGYVRHYVRGAERAGVDLRPGVTITGWQAPNTLTYTSPAGLGAIEAQAVLLATGCRERPRTARLVPGSRPAGVFTTGSLQRFVYEHHLPVGRRAVIVGAELVSLSALLTLGHAHTEVACMVTELPRHQVYLPYLPAKWWLMDILRRTRLTPRARVRQIVGRPRVEAVELEHLDSGQVEIVACDTVVFTGDWIPEHELARLGGLALDEGTRGPRVDAAFRTSAPGVFAAGNLLHGAETADVSGLEGRQAGRAMARYLRERAWPAQPIPIQAEPPVEWIFPNVLAANGDNQLPFGRFTFRVRQFARHVRVGVYQGERLVYAQAFARLEPNHSHTLSRAWVSEVDPAGGAVRVGLVEGG